MSADRNVLFMSYSHLDADMCRQLEAHLRRKASSLGYEVWWDTAVRPGREWRPQIGEMVSRAGACILLASVHSMESPFIWEQEVKPMLAPGVPVAPLYVGAFDYEAYPEVAKLAFLAPFDPDRPLNALPSGEVAHALTIVARGLDGWLPPLGGRTTSQRLPSASDRPVAASEPTYQPGVLLGVPALPHDYQARPALASSFKDELLSAVAGSVAITAGGGDSVGQPVGLHGGGGTGKSVMAAALARDPDVRKAFPDGILWVTVGEVRRNIAVRQQQLATWVGCDLSQCRTNRDRREALVEAFRERRCLVIVDDVWSAATAVEFDVSGGGTRVLYTTRLESLLSHPEIRAQPLRLDTLDADESLAFLAHLTGQQVPLPAEAARVAFFTNGVVLSLSLAAGAFRHGLGWSDLANRFQESSLFSEDIDSNLRAMAWQYRC